MVPTSLLPLDEIINIFPTMLFSYNKYARYQACCQYGYFEHGAFWD